MNLNEAILELKEHGYIDMYDKLAEITNNFYDAMLEKLKETI